jgi:hypothetical protein
MLILDDADVVVHFWPMTTCITVSPARASLNMLWKHRLVQSKTTLVYIQIQRL